MKLKPTEIFAEYQRGCEFKSALGTRGLFEQTKINERFFLGDQWHGAGCGAQRPLVRHNVIKRIGDYKMSQILNNNLSMSFSAEGVPTCETDAPLSEYKGALQNEEIGSVMNCLSNYYNVTAERVNLDKLAAGALKNAYISGTAIIYSYWNPDLKTGIYADSNKAMPIKGDVSCELLSIEDVVFADPYCEEVQSQPYIIISTKAYTENVLREARLYGSSAADLRKLEEGAVNGKITVLTKLFKVPITGGGFEVRGIKVTENATLRPEFSTRLRLYPLAVLRWDERQNAIYGESEITYLIPNQIAINRLITANVWSAMTTGLPIMLVNGDTVTDKITNDPGQIIKIYGSNEDVAGAVNFVAPDVSVKEFDETINTLIENTLTQSGANEVALGDSPADNTSALLTMRDAALMPLKLVRGRYYTFLEELARIWCDFWVCLYGKRQLKLSENGAYTYMPFNGDRYRELIINTKIDINNATVYSEKEQLNTLLTLYDKGIITKNELLSRIPKGMVKDINTIKGEDEVTENDRL